MEVRRHCGFRDFGDLEAQVRLNRRMYATGLAFCLIALPPG